MFLCATGHACSRRNCPRCSNGLCRRERLVAVDLCVHGVAGCPEFHTFLSALQFGYTTVFGAYCAYLFIRTGEYHTLSTIYIQCMCIYIYKMCIYCMAYYIYSLCVCGSGPPN